MKKQKKKVEYKIVPHHSENIEYAVRGNGQQSAIELLQKKADVRTLGFIVEGASGRFVTTIDGRDCDNAKQECWGLYVLNDKKEELSEYGGDTLILPLGKVATWRLCVFTID